jgi:hypothetical protein
MAPWKQSPSCLQLGHGKETYDKLGQTPGPVAEATSQWNREGYVRFPWFISQNSIFQSLLQIDF